jgi:hypothetical protein
MINWRFLLRSCLSSVRIIKVATCVVYITGYVLGSVLGQCDHPSAVSDEMLCCISGYIGLLQFIFAFRFWTLPIWSRIYKFSLTCCLNTFIVPVQYAGLLLIYSRRISKSFSPRRTCSLCAARLIHHMVPNGLPIIAPGMDGFRTRPYTWTYIFAWDQILWWNRPLE